MIGHQLEVRLGNQRKITTIITKNNRNIVERKPLYTLTISKWMFVLNAISILLHKSSILIAHNYNSLCSLFLYALNWRLVNVQTAPKVQQTHSVMKMHVHTECEHFFQFETCETYARIRTHFKASRNSFVFFLFATIDFIVIVRCVYLFELRRRHAFVQP